MAVTLSVEGPASEVSSFCTALETVLLDGERYSYRAVGISPSSIRYLVVNEQGDTEFVMKGHDK